MPGKTSYRVESEEHSPREIHIPIQRHVYGEVRHMQKPRGSASGINTLSNRGAHLSVQSQIFRGSFEVLFISVGATQRAFSIQGRTSHSTRRSLLVAGGRYALWQASVLRTSSSYFKSSNLIFEPHLQS